MNLWIRSQDKMKLFKINNVCITFGDNTREYAIVYDEPNGIEVLATYKTKERTLEVLDEIQRLIEDLQYIGYAIEKEKFCGYRPNVYEMPKE